MWKFLMFNQMPPLGKSLEEEDLQLLQNDLNSNVQVQPALQSAEAEYQLTLQVHELEIDSDLD